MAVSPALQRTREHLEDLLFAVDAARSSVVLHVQTSQGSGEFSIARGALRGAAYGDVSGAPALRAALDAGVLTYQVHQVTQHPPAIGPDGKEIDAGPRLSELVLSATPGGQGRSGHYMRSQLVRTPFPLPSDLSPLEAKVAERLGKGTSPLALVKEVEATPEEFLQAVRRLVERGLIVPGGEKSSAPGSFSATLPSAESRQPLDVVRRAAMFGGATMIGGGPMKGAATLFGGSPSVPNVTERPQPDDPPTRRPHDRMGSTQMAGSFSDLALSEPATLRHHAPPEATNLARASVATIALASGQDIVPVPSQRFEAETLRELGGLNRAIHSSRRPVLPSADEVSAAAHLEPELPVVGRYEVLARIKSGGVGSVYLCRLKGTSGFQRLFAMKVLRVGVAHDPLLIREFFREARVLSTLHHPNVIGIVDAGSEKEPYLVLDYVEGGSLFELCQASPETRDPAVIVAIMLDALAGTSAVHQATDDAGEPLQLVHHDLTPHNLLVGVDGACRVADFGVARTGAPREGERQYGKPAYVAPERYLGAPGDHRSDLFSLGVVLYTALTGVNPFAGANSEETRRNILLGHVPPPSTVGLRPHPCFDWVCEKALAPKPNERFQSAEEMMMQLRRIAAREELIASPSQVAQWVRSVLHDRLDARRKLLRPTQPPPQRTSEAPPAPQFETAEAPQRSLSNPPSSYASWEKTEALPSRPSAPMLESPSSFEPPPLVTKKVALSIAISCVLIVLATAIFAPELFGSLFASPVEADASEAQKPAIEPTEGNEKQKPEVIIPEIRPAGK